MLHNAEPRMQGSFEEMVRSYQMLFAQHIYESGVPSTADTPLRQEYRAVLGTQRVRAAEAPVIKSFEADCQHYRNAYIQDLYSNGRVNKVKLLEQQRHLSLGDGVVKGLVREVRQEFHYACDIYRDVYANDLREDGRVDSIVLSDEQDRLRLGLSIVRAIASTEQSTFATDKKQYCQAAARVIHQQGNLDSDTLRSLHLQFSFGQSLLHQIHQDIQADFQAHRRTYERHFLKLLQQESMLQPDGTFSQLAQDRLHNLRQTLGELNPALLTEFEQTTLQTHQHNRIRYAEEARQVIQQMTDPSLIRSTAKERDALDALQIWFDLSPAVAAQIETAVREDLNQQASDSIDPMVFVTEEPLTNHEVMPEGATEIAEDPTGVEALADLTAPTPESFAGPAVVETSADMPDHGAECLDPPAMVEASANGSDVVTESAEDPAGVAASMHVPGGAMATLEDQTMVATPAEAHAVSAEASTENVGVLTEASANDVSAVETDATGELVEDLPEASANAASVIEIGATAEFIGAAVDASMVGVPVVDTGATLDTIDTIAEASGDAVTTEAMTESIEALGETEASAETEADENPEAITSVIESSVNVSAASQTPGIDTPAVDDAPAVDASVAASSVPALSETAPDTVCDTTTHSTTEDDTPFYEVKRLDHLGMDASKGQAIDVKAVTVSQDDQDSTAELAQPLWTMGRFNRQVMLVSAGVVAAMTFLGVAVSQRTQRLQHATAPSSADVLAETQDNKPNAPTLPADSIRAVFAEAQQLIQERQVVKALDAVAEIPTGDSSSSVVEQILQQAIQRAELYYREGLYSEAVTIADVMSQKFPEESITQRAVVFSKQWRTEWGANHAALAAAQKALNSQQYDRAIAEAKSITHPVLLANAATIVEFAQNAQRAIASDVSGSAGQVSVPPSGTPYPRPYPAQAAPTRSQPAPQPSTPAPAADPEPTPYYNPDPL